MSIPHPTTSSTAPSAAETGLFDQAIRRRVPSLASQSLSDD
jgi:hypothetical protein